MTALLQAAGAWGLDIAFFVIILLGILLGVWRGLIKFVCKIAGTIFSIVIAFLCCVPFKNATEGLFGLEGVLRKSISAVPILGTWITVVISFLALAVIVRLLAWAVGAIGKALVEKVKSINAIDKTLGGLLGLLCAGLAIFFLLAICLWIPANGLHNFIESSYVVGPIFKWDWFRHAAKFAR